MHFAICRWVYAIGLSLCVSASAQHAPETTIEIDATKTASYTIPRTIFGTFLEPIGNSIYNGLWAELLQNPSFEDNLWDVKHVADAIIYMATLPLDANVQFITVMATAMPYIGRG